METETETGDGNAFRLQNELSLLEAMYPTELSYDASRKEMTFKPKNRSSLCLRIPESYPSSGRPELISASIGAHDLRNELKKAMSEAPDAEEMLDAILTAFQDIADAAHSEVQSHVNDVELSKTELGGQAHLTVIIWLHHLLSTTKRKAILAPPTTSVSGISKPGYPGVLIFTGPAQDVNGHTKELRGLNWQAFQVRAEEEELWTFKHGTGVVEWESMAEIVDDIIEDKKRVFMEAMRMK
ncbi:hypothetical protein NA57DRAFT_47278 [Rhizodiscina lignyota]|uniref:RWD domain-containing protein n=1 Tax=Rhizodiscina lignyota TaxID=1504668 RepID=A0A9P4I7M4_9PEZI|nr:hypothetical protein NA57DRAFT_47278 [Rhizodiscina lignyota]